MITKALQSAVFDVLKGSELSSDYPASIRDYVKQSNADKRSEDIAELVPVLGSGSSIFSEVDRLKTNDLLLAFGRALKDFDLDVGEQTMLGKVLHSFKQAEGQYARVFEQERQLLLLMLTGEDSPVVQIAADVDVDTSNLPGIPTVEVRAALLGGARWFYKGELTDDSWRARLNKVLEVVS